MSTERLRRWRLAALTGYVLVVAVVWKRTGIPLERLQTFGWVAGALLIATVGRRRGALVDLVRDWVPLAAILTLYDLSRGMADSTGMPVLRAAMVRLERFVFGGRVLAEWAQDRLGPFSGAVRWWEVPISLVYLSHFVVSFVVLGVLWARERREFRCYRDRLLVLTGLGLATYVLLPAAPPWMASRDGLTGPIRRVVLRGMNPFGLDLGTTLVRLGARSGNDIAALPSLHAGWATLLALYVGGRVRRRWWPLLALYPLAMSAALVVSGEHYVIDAVLGAFYALVAVALVSWWERLPGPARRLPWRRVQDRSARGPG